MYEYNKLYSLFPKYTEIKYKNYFLLILLIKR